MGASRRAAALLRSVKDAYCGGDAAVPLPPPPPPPSIPPRPPRPSPPPPPQANRPTRSLVVHRHQPREPLLRRQRRRRRRRLVPRVVHRVRPTRAASSTAAAPPSGAPAHLLPRPLGAGDHHPEYGCIGYEPFGKYEKTELGFDIDEVTGTLMPFPVDHVRVRHRVLDDGDLRGGEAVGGDGSTTREVLYELALDPHVSPPVLPPPLTRHTPSPSPTPTSPPPPLSLPRYDQAHIIQEKAQRIADPNTPRARAACGVVLADRGRVHHSNARLLPDPASDEGVAIMKQLATDLRLRWRDVTIRKEVNLFPHAPPPSPPPRSAGAAATACRRRWTRWCATSSRRSSSSASASSPPAASPAA